MVLFGFVCSFSMILLPSVINGNGTNHESFSFNNGDTFWYVSSLYISQIIGSFLPLGCGNKIVGKKTIPLLVNVPMILAWAMLGISWSKNILLIATVILGLCIGYLQRTVSDYISQIPQPHLRKALASFTDVFRSFGAFLVSGLGLITNWRTAAVVGVFINVCVIIALSLVPEAPKLLNTGGKLTRAERILHWLLLWWQPRQSTKELQEVPAISETKDISGVDAASHQKYPDDGILFFQQLKLLKSWKMLKSLGLASILLLIPNFTGIVASQPFVYMLSEDYSMPINDSTCAFVFHTVAFVASILFIVTTHMFNRNVVILCSVAVATISTGMLFICESWFAFFSYCMLFFASSYGLEGNIWSMLDDIFSQEERVFAFRLVAAIDYFYNWISVVSYPQMRRLMEIQYVFLIFMIFNICGSFFISIYVYKMKKIPVEETLSNINQKEDNKRQLDL